MSSSLPEITPRLLTTVQAAGYLNLPQAEVIRQGIGCVRFGIRTLYDRAAIDAHLDELSRLTPVQKDQVSDPEAALERFAANFKHAARRS
ncbi:MAG: hypothetical protein JWP35_2543 [Caulobacter sp.]|nr:hypothetical protein [Caulobacter sp.]